MSHHDYHVGTEPGVSLAAKRLLEIVAYYLVATVLLILALRYSPDVVQRVAGTPLKALGGDERGIGSRAIEALSTQGIESLSLRDQAAAALMAMVGAVATALPVAWVYSLTRRRRGFEQSMVHIILLLPIAVAGMVVLIRSSLALAFSLTGIVAVLRFRNTLEDVKDGVFVFIAVSIGMSAAVGALAIGVVTSVVFNACVLVLWWLDFARRPMEGGHGGLRKLARLPRVVAAHKRDDLDVAADTAMGDELFAQAAQAWRRQLQITAERGIPGPKRFNATLRVHSVSGDATRPVVEELLGIHAKRWVLSGFVPGDGDTLKLTYRVRVGHGARAALLDAVRAAPSVTGVELT
ncbi:MAG: hypothetical protein MNPFHGCM_02978 [Gemmatimonadaceae bacterium]|nr:hypothetical protein [Gemmatimonadaceae bacterium]